MEYVVGVLLGLAVPLFGRAVGFDRDRSFGVLGLPSAPALWCQGRAASAELGAALASASRCVSPQSEGMTARGGRRP